MIVTLGMAGCAQTAANLPPVPQEIAAAPPYRVQVGDTLALRLYFTPELNEDVTVRPDGRISTTLAASVPAFGRTPEQIAAELTAAYAAELKAPRIAVEVKDYAPVRIYVAGEVAAPGEFSAAWPPPTLVQAVARAGGVKLTADADRVFVVRRGEDDRPQVFATNYRAAITGAEPAADIRLTPFDVVYVPKTGTAELYRWVNQHIQQFVPVSWGFSYNVSPLIQKP